MIYIIIAILVLGGVTFFIIKNKKKETPIVVPEPEPIPEPVDTSIKIELENSGDNTSYLRGIINKDNSVYKLSKDGRFLAHGVLETDAPNRVGLQVGEHGIILIEGRSHVEIDGQNATIYNIDPIIPLDSNYPKEGAYMSQRKFIKGVNSEYLHIHDINYESALLRLGVRPMYDRANEFDHAIDIDNCKYVAIEDFNAKNVLGDGIYIRDSHDVYVRKATIDWNGRQGGAMISGGRAYLEKITIVFSARSGFDIEGNTTADDAKDFIITYSNFKNHLYGLPMGGPGFVKNVFIVNNIYNSNNVWSRGDGKTRRRENVIFANCKATSLGDYDFNKNVLIDGIEQDDLKFAKLSLGRFQYCENVTIRNIKNFNNYGWMAEGKEPFALIESVGTPNSAFKIYDNEIKIGVVQKLDPTVTYNNLERDKWYAIAKTNIKDFHIMLRSFEEFSLFGIVKNPSPDMKLKEGEYFELYPIHFPEYTPTADEIGKITFDPESKEIEMQWDRLYTNGYGWREEDYNDDGWRPEWINKIKDSL